MLRPHGVISHIILFSPIISCKLVVGSVVLLPDLYLIFVRVSRIFHRRWYVLSSRGTQYLAVLLFLLLAATDGYC